MQKFKIKITKEEDGVVPTNSLTNTPTTITSEILSMEVEEINLQRIITAIIGSRKRKSKA